MFLQKALLLQNPPPVRELYVYYQLGPEHVESLMTWVNWLQCELQKSHPGLSVKWLRRTDEGRNGLSTWMEIYTHPAGIGAALQAEIDRHANAHPLFQSHCTRHLEVFEVCAVFYADHLPSESA